MTKRRKMTMVVRRGGAFVVTHSGIKRARDLRAQGHNLAEIAERFGMSPDAFRECRKRQPKLAEACEFGHAELEGQLVNVLVGKALNGNIQACCFLLKSRHHFREVGKVPGSGPDTEVNVRINMPPLISDEQADRLLANIKEPIDVTPEPQDPIPQALPVPKEEPFQVTAHGRTKVERG